MHATTSRWGRTAVGLVLAGAAAMGGCAQSMDDGMMMKKDGAMMEKGDAMSKDGQMMNKDGMMEKK